MPKTSSDYSRERRKRIKSAGKKEIRGIYSTPSLESEIKKAAKDIIDNHEFIALGEK